MPGISRDFVWFKRRTSYFATFSFMTVHTFPWDLVATIEIVKEHKSQNAQMRCIIASNGIGP
jgi:hypothetical protein